MEHWGGATNRALAPIKAPTSLVSSRVFREA